MRTPAVALILLAASCGGDEDPFTVAEARDRDGVVRVQGYLLERGGELRLCEAILESFPPQCGEPSLRVEGTSLSPSEERVTLLGEIEDGTLKIVARA